MSLAVRLRRGSRPDAAARGTVDDVDAATPRPVSTAYVGLVTRTLAFGLDAAIVNGAAIVVTAIFTLTYSILSLPDDLKTVAAAVGGVMYILWVTGYFVTFWATTGQTPGSRALRIRVRPQKGGRLAPRRALLRFVALTLAALPLFAGFLIILVDDRRRGLHDLLARTVVVEDEERAVR